MQYIAVFSRIFGIAVLERVLCELWNTKWVSKTIGLWNVSVLIIPYE